LGQAFLNQQQDVVNAIQRLRQSAYNLGNLQSTPQQQVINDGGYIEIVPVNTQMIYVPVYQPAEVYYQSADGAPFITFSVGYAIGAWLNCDFDWVNHHIIVWQRDHPRPANWWHEPVRQRTVGHVTVWRPDNQADRVRVYGGDRGWGVPNQPVKPVVATVGRSPSDSVMPRRTPVQPARPEAPANRPVIRPEVRQPAPTVNANPPQHESNGAFIGAQSSRDTKAYSDRGRQSLQTANHAAPAQHSAPVQHSEPARPSGGSAAGHSSNSHDKH